MKLPKYLDIELNTSCNLQCEPCPYKEVHKTPQFMNLDLLEEIINQIDWDCSIKFCQRGEPLLSSILIEAIKKAHKKGLRTVINTNGFYLEHFAKDLIKSGLDELILSDYGHPHQFQHGCTFSSLNQFHDSPIKFTVKTEKPKKWIGITHHIIKSVYYDYLDTTEDSTSLPNWKCSQLYEKLIIDPDGKVRCCCGNTHPNKYVGSIKLESIRTIWDGIQMTFYRLLHDEGASHHLVMCRKCAYRRSFIK